MPSTDNTVAFASRSVSPWATCATHSHPDLVVNANWKGDGRIQLLRKGSCDQSSDEISHDNSSDPSRRFLQGHTAHSQSLNDLIRDLRPGELFAHATTKTRHPVQNPREGEHDPQSCPMVHQRHSASRSSSSKTTCPAPIRQATWVGTGQLGAKTPWCLWAPLKRATWRHCLVQLGRHQGPVEPRTICHLNQIVCAFGSMFDGVGWNSSATLPQCLHRTHCAVTTEQQKVLPPTEELEPLHHFALCHQTVVVV